MSHEYMVVFVTASSTDEGERISEAVVTERLAACVNIVDRCRSVYVWQGKLEKSDEALLVIKTSRSLFPELARRVTEMHSYDVPEIIGHEISEVAEPYRRFLEDSLNAPK